MARIRTIKPEFFRHFELFIAEQEEGLPLRVAYAGLWTVADREGRFKWRPEILKLDILPFDNIDFSRVLHALATRGFIVRYEAESKIYGFIPTFRQHQIINHRESKSILPDPEKCKNSEKNSRTKSNSLSTRAPRVNHASTTRAQACPGVPTGEKEREGEYSKNSSRCSEFFTSEAKNASEVSDSIGPPVIEIPIIGNGCSGFQISQSMIDEWQSTYKAVNVLQSLKEIRQWNIANPERRKTAKGVHRHIITWLKREQDRGGTRPLSSAPQSKTYYHNLAAIAQAKAEIMGECDETD
jgi:hypothetical protein